MKEATYTVLATNGKEYKWTFTENLPTEQDYGNGIYIAIEHPNGEYTYMDCRYARKYDFDLMCVDFLVEYYGANLDELSRDD